MPIFNVILTKKVAHVNIFLSTLNYSPYRFEILSIKKAVILGQIYKKQHSPKVQQQAFGLCR